MTKWGTHVHPLIIARTHLSTDYFSVDSIRKYMHLRQLTTFGVPASEALLMGGLCGTPTVAINSASIVAVSGELCQP
jgi:hypothetical protein